jgi:outer membrane immunogenic protein
MKKLLLIAAAAFLAAPALAADLPIRAPVKAPAVVAPVGFSWTGCYLGAQIGYAWQRDSNSETQIGVGPGDPTSGPAKPDGIKAGGYAGCNWQTGQWVIGLEGDGEWTNLKGSVTYPGTGTLIDDYIETRTRWQASLRPRVGIAFDRSLFYATGGVAFANVEHTYVCPECSAPNSDTFKDTLIGWTVGAGLDYAITNNWIARVEYRYADFGKVTNTPVNAWSGYSEEQSITEHAIRGGIAYKW